MPGNNDDEAAWYRNWFGREYLDLYPHRNREEASADIDGVEKLLPLAERQPILDLACGGGRHALELARRGYCVVGLDLSEELLDVARKSARREGLLALFVRGDNRALPFASAFGAVLNFFTSFGYFDSDEENASVLRNIRRALRPGGWFIIDYLNKDLVLRELVAEDRMVEGRKEVTQRRRYDPLGGRIEKTIFVRDGDVERSYRESVRLYGRDELLAMASAAGLEVERVLGALDGRAFDAHAPRMVVTGVKPDNAH